MQRVTSLLVFVLITYCIQITAFHGEPNCPQHDRFTFEEKLLEKMVRVEHKLELIEEKLKTWEKTLNTKIAEIDEAEIEMEKTAEEKLALIESDSNNKLQELEKAENERMKNVESMKETHDQQMRRHKEMLEAAIADLKKEATELTKSVSDTQANMETKLQDTVKAYEEALKAITDQYQTPAVAFQANTGSNEVTISGTVQFSVIDMNKGDAFDSSTGIFTAPKQGIYSFTLQLCPHADKWITAKVKTNDGNTVASIYHTDSYNGVCVSSSGVVLLNKGQTVSVQGEGSNTVHANANSINIFSGVLLHSTL